MDYIPIVIALYIWLMPKIFLMKKLEQKIKERFSDDSLNIDTENRIVNVVFHNASLLGYLGSMITIFVSLCLKVNADSILGLNYQIIILIAYFLGSLTAIIRLFTLDDKLLSDKSKLCSRFRYVYLFDFWIFLSNLALAFIIFMNSINSC